MTAAAITAAPVVSFLDRHLLQALECIATIMQDEKAPAATRLRAAFGIIELARAPEKAARGKAELQDRAQTLAAAGPEPAAPRETFTQRQERQRREKTLARQAEERAARERAAAAAATPPPAAAQPPSPHRAVVGQSAQAALASLLAGDPPKDE